MLRINCPSEECTCKWDQSYVSQFLTEAEFERYTKLKRIAVVNADPTLRWCIRPWCEEVNTGSSEHPHIRCGCAMEYCFKCNLQWHPDSTCEEVI